MYRVGLREFGPVSGEHLADKLNRGDLTGYVEVRDIQKKRFRPLSDTPAFREVFQDWMNQADAREERLADERAQASSQKVRAVVTRVVLVVLLIGMAGGGIQMLLNFLGPSPKAVDLDSLIAYAPCNRGTRPH